MVARCPDHGRPGRAAAPPDLLHAGAARCRGTNRRPLAKTLRIDPDRPQEVGRLVRIGQRWSVMKRPPDSTSRRRRWVSTRSVSLTFHSSEIAVRGAFGACLGLGIVPSALWPAQTSSGAARSLDTGSPDDNG
jgi:hypothetical protein